MGAALYLDLRVYLVHFDNGATVEVEADSEGEARSLAKHEAEPGVSVRWVERVS